jgi:hypothetical protein
MLINLFLIFLSIIAVSILVLLILILLKLRKPVGESVQDFLKTLLTTLRKAGADLKARIGGGEIVLMWAAL